MTGSRLPTSPAAAIVVERQRPRRLPLYLLQQRRWSIGPTDYNAVRPLAELDGSSRSVPSTGKAIAIEVSPTLPPPMLDGKPPAKLWAAARLNGPSGLISNVVTKARGSPPASVHVLTNRSIVSMV